MRPVHAARLDKVRPVVVLTRSVARPHLRWVTVAPIYGSPRGLHTEVPVGTGNGLESSSVINCDNIQTIPAADLGRQIGQLLPGQEQALAEAIRAAFDLL